MQPNILTQYLTAISFKQLVAILATHNLRRTAKDTKADVVIQLQQFLTNPETLTTIVAQLDEDAKDALRRLLAADGALPVHTFEERYGPIRPYKPSLDHESLLVGLFVGYCPQLIICSPA